MKLRELFENILLEYNREKTAATFGNKLLKALMTDRSILPSALGTARAYLVQKEKIGEPIEPNTRQVIINDILSVIEQGDPTQHKEYSQWLVKCYANEDVILEDIISKGRDWLEVYDEMIRWCFETFEPSKWHREFYCVRFQAEADRNWFLLRWSS